MCKYVHVMYSQWQNAQKLQKKNVFISLETALGTAAYIHYPNHSHCHPKTLNHFFSHNHEIFTNQ